MDTAFTAKLIDNPRHPRGRLGWLVPCGMFLSGIASLSIDVPLAAVFRQDHEQLPKFLDRPLREALENCEPFGHGFGAFLIIVAVGALTPEKRKALPWLAAASWGSGLVANAIKALISRTRPSFFDFEAGTVWATFVKASSGGMNVQSFPSAHTATAVGLAVMLAHLYPRGQWFFGMMACLVGAQRIVCSAHFPSDVLAGATVGWLVGTICVNHMKSNSERSKNDLGSI